MQDSNTLFIFVGELPSGIVKDYIKSFINESTEKIKENYGITVQKGYKINHPKIGGNFSSKVYVWVDDKRLKNYLIGNKPNGQSFNDSEDVHQLITPVVDKGTIYNLKFSSCSLWEVSEEYYPHILTTARPLPKGVTCSDIERVFTRYAVNGVVHCSVKDEYPLITFKNGSNDASFALVMQMVTEFPHKRYVKFCHHSHA